MFKPSNAVDAELGHLHPPNVHDFGQKSHNINSLNSTGLNRDENWWEGEMIIINYIFNKSGSILFLAFWGVIPKSISLALHHHLHMPSAGFFIFQLTCYKGQLCSVEHFIPYLMPGL